ncbi:MAG TPA: hypothetical protein VF170_13810 [Planctomycetaceae bacterium]
MTALETAALAYFAAGVACWLVLVAAYARKGTRSRGGFAAFLAKTVLGLPVVLLWPLLVIALLRRERVPGGRAGEE